MLALITRLIIILFSYLWLDTSHIPICNAPLPVLLLYVLSAEMKSRRLEEFFSQSPSQKQTRGQNELFSLRPYQLSSVMRICVGIKVSEINSIIYGRNEVSGR
jgi:hypothetical protein